jgi:hypothetical protein
MKNDGFFQKAKDFRKNKFLKPETRNPQPATRNPKPETFLKA